MSILQAIAAVLLVTGSALVLHTVWAADQADSEPVPDAPPVNSRVGTEEEALRRVA